MATVEKIVANHETDGIIVILDNGQVIPHCFEPFAAQNNLSTIKGYFAGEVNGTENLADYVHSDYAMYSHEVEHPEAVTVYTKEKGWLI